MGDYHANPRKVIAKQPTCVETGECRAPRRGGKNTRHWCKGRVGIPHTWEWQRQRGDLEREQRYGLTYNRVTEEHVCFGCEKIDNRRRHYCRRCGEPWPQLRHDRLAGRRWSEWLPCIRCSAPWMVRHRPGMAQWSPSGAVVR